MDATTPLRVQTDPQSNVLDLLRERLQADPHKGMFVRLIDGAWREVSATSFNQQVRTLAARLLALGVAEGDRVAILSSTRYEWTLAEFATWQLGAVVVPIYDSSSPEQIARILDDSTPSFVFVESRDHRDRLHRAEQLRGTDPHRLWLRLDHLDPDTLEREPRSAAVEAELTRRGTAATLDSLATLVYSSGTTGQTKASRISHGNLSQLVRNVAADYTEVIRSDSSTLLFLPLAHVLARGVLLVAVERGMLVGHLSEPTQLLGQLGPYKPTFLVVVPRLLEKIEAAVAAKAESAHLGGLFRKARQTAIDAAEWRSRYGDEPAPAPLRRAHRFYDVLFFRKMRALFGGRIETLLCGASPLDPDTARFFTGAGLPVVEGYGLTETTATVTGNRPGEVRFGTVGRPVPGASVRISDEGEILVAGIGVISGYLHDEDTEGAFVDGYFRTGDLGSLDDDGFLTVTGRAKDLIVTSYGKNIAPGPIEQALQRNPLIAQAVVVGNDRPYLGALIAADPEEAARWAQARGIELTGRSPAELPELRAEIDS
ncbi:MAG: AMP-dependent synthetase/ligase, partial [Mycetocola sp.]